MKTYHIHIKGRVQGVGFRPYVFHLAKSHQLVGSVCNTSDGVHIHFNATPATADSFHKICIRNKPGLALITNSNLEQVADQEFEGFRIVESHETETTLSPSPDFAICADCLEEMNDPANRRYHYPFITCTNCGPRFSILTGLPYDRPTTTMEDFVMCPECQAEYDDPDDRRFYSQTNSCPTCGISLSFHRPEGPVELAQGAIIQQVVEQLRAESIVAVKGIGGYLLLCNAASTRAVSRLRKLKNRPEKPFAVLYKNIDSIKRQFKLCDQEREALVSPEAPIVLLDPAESFDLPTNVIAPSLTRIGVMLPYAPLLKLIAEKFDKPLIATSANISGAPILQEMGEGELFRLADFILSNNRPISYGQDDSVMQVTSKNKKPVLLRKSRGFAPATFALSSHLNPSTLAMGAEMKGVFAVSTNSNAYVSQYLGNLSFYENQIHYKKVLHDLTSLVKAQPSHIAIDCHPGYFSHQLGKSLAVELDAKVQEVQHHEAHFAAILAEKNLLEDKRVLGVVWDGTGYGSDGHIWGGEFFEFRNNQIRRTTHIEYFSHLAGDQMAIDNRLCALSLSGKEYRKSLQTYFTKVEWQYYNKALENPDLSTSSMGRVFDAVAFLAGLSEKNGFEGQAAMLLENEARKILTGKKVDPYSFAVKKSDISLEPMFNELFEDWRNKSELIPARFFLTLVAIIMQIAEIGGYEKIAFSGGVFQNNLLVDLIYDELTGKYDLYFHEELSPNDENIAFGQLAYLKLLENQKKYDQKQIKECV